MRKKLRPSQVRRNVKRKEDLFKRRLGYSESVRQEHEVKHLIVTNVRIPAQLKEILRII